MNLAAINGTWQTIVFLNFYMAENGKDTALPCDVILFEMNEELQKICSNILLKFSFVRNVFTFKNMPIEKYANLWIGKLFSSEAKVIVNKYASLPIILFEEGLHSYIEPKKFSLVNNFFRGQYSFRYKLAITLRYFLGKNLLISDRNFSHLVFSEHEKKIKKKYFLLPLVKEDKQVIVNNEYLTFIIDKIKDLQKQAFLINSDKPTVLIVGQCFSNYDLLSFEEELALYLKLIDVYLKKDYNVIWKGHPRAKQFDEKIKSIYKDVIDILEDSPLPLEVFTLNKDLIELSGVSSSSLLYNEILFNKKTTQIAYMISNKVDPNNIWYSDFNLMFKLIDHNIERIEL
ncbi:polysialyltransferase family glycosyltransferase [Epilithonimonas sp.]|uniref:polysialyltransferase family glycosyltransferase n=1 Tax=Epilithonimonas sp. TaxID=2894511 RepID=UPI0028AB7A41|nr:polysialyltransferase family glycosyltransferase [Epilithonimonas sp.]